MNIVERKDLPSNFTEMMKTESHHDHEIVNVDGVLRWKEDDFVSRFTDACNLNDIIVGLHANGNGKNSEIYRELYRKMGYSLNGYWEVFYWEMNNDGAADYVQLNCASRGHNYQPSFDGGTLVCECGAWK